MNIGFIIVIFIVILVGISIWAYYQLFRPQENPRDDTLVDFFSTQYTNGYSQGVLKKVIHGTKRKGIVFYPKDKDRMKIVEDEKNGEDNREVTHWVNEEKMEWLPRGRWSRER